MANCNLCGSSFDHQKTAPAGSFDANGFQLKDMHGNVWEWVDDCYHPSYVGAPLDGSSWTSECADGRRVVRGGSWFVDPAGVCAAIRLGTPSFDRDPTLGFRVARTLGPAAKAVYVAHP
jgi:formylglycine-generating enzyme required for sulfatase activity